MAGAFSGHLLDSFKQSSTPIVVTSGAMSFTPQAHGFPATTFGNTSVPGPSEETAVRIATIQAKLNQKLGPEFISQRPGPGGGPKLTYAEGWKIINLANEVFGFNGWSSSVVNITTDFMDYSEESRRYNVGVTAIVRVTLRDGVYHEDVGYGLLENSRSKGAALDKCKKEAITDALKRTLRNFGNLLGNCLYDKAYAQEIVKIKVPPVKFNTNELYRRPEFAGPKPSLPSELPPPPALAQRPQAGPSNPGPTREEKPPAKPESASEQAEKPMAYIPWHLRPEVALSTIQQATAPKEAAQGSSAQRTKEPPLAANRPAPQQPTGLHTPIQTPAQRIAPQTRRHNEQSPLARQQPQKRRETLAEAAEGEDDSPVDLPSLGGEENYGLNSEDDAFLAAVDLGDGDLGRPIDFEEGIGGVSVVDDSSPDQEQSTRSAVAKSPVIQHNVDSATRSSESSAQIRRAVTLPNRSTTGRVDSGGSSSSSVASDVIVGAASAVSATSGLPGRHPGASRATHTTSGNRSPMQPLLQKSSLPPQAQRPTNHQAVPSTTGVKRNADAMHGSSSSSLRPMQGAGHTRQPQQNAAAVRRPLVSPDPMASVEFKRMKR